MTPVDGGVLALIDAGGLPRAAPQDPWRVLVVDDDPEMHLVTRLCFADFEYEGRPLTVLGAGSGAEARAVLKAESDVALVLLDVVMESEHAGLALARWIREELNNRTVRIVLRTGQFGEVPPREMARQYEIDDYRTKADLTFERLQALAVTALRTYKLLRDQEARERRLAQYTDELERFAYAASHDLQTPLRTIVRFAQRLQEKYRVQLPSEGQEYLGYIVDGARQLHRLIEDLLEYTAVGRRDAPPTPVPLGEAVRRACADLASEIATRRAVVECGALPTVSGNAAQLQELFVQLIDNALKFQPGEKPVVSIVARLVERNWEIRISDRGIGIEARHLDKIFEPFQRLHPPDRFPGSGIGLAICRKVVQLHSGELRAQSVPGTGTTMIVTLTAAA